MTVSDHLPASASPPRGLALWLAALVLLLAALLPIAARAQTRAPLVLAAASMQEALSDAADTWARRGHARPTLSFAASSALARQAAAGAPADIFVSADAEWMDDLAKRGLVVPGTRGVLAGNRLVVVAPKGSTRVGQQRGAALGRILGAGPLAMADPDAVPAGRYGRAALQRLDAWDSVRPKVVGAESVRAALALVERGAAPYGIVYATDVRVAPNLMVAGVFPARSHPPIIYPIARLRGGPSAAAAEGFRRFLLSPDGKAILRRHGFAAR